ncbi:Ig-like domain-containing protein [Fodinibius saliphilus]|uniref:Ig-like domain-containing protein n=1 Tax=Fodinibius saliphilus TaxID=1920650 RepID=UPI001486E449|nr:Ig-like domain-containing protein [Fodinibius saliphilus]
MKLYSWISVAILGILFVVGCATPSSPTGGPPDKEGPKIIKTEPQTGTTNFTGQEIILHFSEFVDRASLEQAIILEPDVGLSFDLDWGRKSVAVEFDRAIPDSTTLIVTVGTDFKDVNNNKLAAPKKVAVSTGDEIDDGKLTGRVLNAQTGNGAEGDRILLYREPVDLSQKANYIAETDTGGTFNFSYLSEGRYKAFWVDDRNRNKIWDRQNERTQPFKDEFVELEDGDTDTLGTIYKTPVDTTKPSLQGIGLFSSQRLRMRFSENVVLTDSINVLITDTTGNVQSDAYPLYVQPGERFVMFAYSTEDLVESGNYRIDISGLVDEFGNPLSKVEQHFTGSAQEDTTRQRIIERNSVSGYYPEDPFTITYAKPIEGSLLRDSLKVVEGDSLVERWPNVKMDKNKFSILPGKQWKDGVTYEVRLWDPAIEDYRKFSPEIWHSSRMGALNALVEDSTVSNVRLEIINDEAEFYRDTVFSDSIEIKQLPPLKYTVIAYEDLNDNGNWDFGRVDPFKAPEPYFIQKDVPVEKAMTGELTIIF